MLWLMSQMTKPNANAMPAQKHHQNQRANRALARIAIPTTIGATHPASPRIGFGKPNTLPCQESRLALHWTSPEKSHDAIASGFASECSFSTVSENAAHQPITPAITSHAARPVGRAWVCWSGMPRIMASGSERMPRSAPCEIVADVLDVVGVPRMGNPAAEVR